MSEPTRDELLRQLAEAQADAEAAVLCLIFLELGEIYTSLEASEDQVAAGLRDACEALTEPQGRLDALDGEIVRAEGKCVEWSEHLAPDNPPDKRAAARLHYEEWTAEVAALRSRRDEMERGYRDLFSAREEARTRLQVVMAAKKRVMFAQLNPFGDPLAQATEMYKSLRMPMLVPVLLRNDRESPEWPRAIEELRELCARSGYRTDDLPSEAEQMARAMTEGMADAATTPPPPAPSMVDVMKQTDAEFENMRLQNVREVIDDRRRAQPQAAPPRRSHMDVPFRVKDLPG